MTCLLSLGFNLQARFTLQMKAKQVLLAFHFESLQVSSFKLLLIVVLPMTYLHYSILLGPEQEALEAQRASSFWTLPPVVQP